jgi:hypothetical protein
LNRYVLALSRVSTLPLVRGTRGRAACPTGDDEEKESENNISGNLCE